MMFFICCFETKSSFTSIFIWSNWLVAVHSKFWIYEGNSTEFQELCISCTVCLAISWLWLKLLIMWCPPLLSTLLHVHRRWQQVVVFTGNVHFSWNSEWWIIQKCTWDGWSNCSQNFVMKKNAWENYVFNNLEVWLWPEMSLTCIPSILLLYVRVCLW